MEIAMMHGFENTTKKEWIEENMEKSKSFWGRFSGFMGSLICKKRFSNMTDQELTEKYEEELLSENTYIYLIRIYHD